jgi:hypothetical protein
MDIKRAGSQPSAKGPAEYFTGTVRIDPLFQAPTPARVPPGEQHWHGASPTAAMTHIAVQEALDGKAVDWMEQVSDEQYDGR